MLAFDRREKKAQLSEKYECEMYQLQTLKYGYNTYVILCVNIY